MTNDERPEENTDLPPLPAWLRAMKWMVFALGAVMIVGFALMIIVLVQRLQSRDIPLPDEITLPHGASVVSFTQSADWYAVVTDDDQILVFDRQSGTLTQTVKISAD